MRSVIESVFRSLRYRESWGAAFPEELPQQVLEQLVDDSPRQVWQELEDACAKAAIAGRKQLLLEDLSPRESKSRSSGIGFLADIR